jgi:hypothetical protein
MLQRSLELTKVDIERGTASNNSHPMPRPSPRNNQTALQLPADFSPVG